MIENFCMPPMSVGKTIELLALEPLESSIKADIRSRLIDILDEQILSMNREQIGALVDDQIEEFRAFNHSPAPE